MRFSPFLRQLYVALPPFLTALSAGGAVGFPTVLLHQLRGNDSAIQIDFDTASWMGSIHGLAGIPSVLMPLLMQWKGRKYTFIFTSVIIFIGWLLAYFAADASVILLSESFHGLGTNSFLAVSCLTITEMMSPKYRDTFMQIIYILQTLGMITGGLLVQYLHWTTISVIMAVPIVISLVIAFTVPESPYWLAFEKDFSKCETNFVWLRGTDVEARKELDELVNKSRDRANSYNVSSVKDICKRTLSRDFLIPAVHICVLQFLIYGSGSLVTMIYCIEMLKNLTSNNSVSAFGGFIVNSLFCVGVCINIVLDRYCKTKPILLWSVFCAVVCLLTGSVFSYCQAAGLWSKETLAGLFCISGFILFASIGIVGCAYSIATSLIPVPFRGIGGALIVVNTGLFHTLSLKSAPYMFLYLDMWGTFLVYSVLSTVCAFIIWKYVPEIKGRTLQEIENYYKYNLYSGKTSINDDAKHSLKLKPFHENENF